MVMSDNSTNGSTKKNLSFFEKVELFVSKNKNTILFIFLILVFLNQCSVKSKLDKVSKKQVQIEASMRSVDSINIKSSNDNRIYIEGILLTVDNKNLKQSNSDLFKKYVAEKAKNAQLNK